MINLRVDNENLRQDLERIMKSLFDKQNQRGHIIPVQVTEIRYKPLSNWRVMLSQKEGMKMFLKEKEI